MNNVEHKSVKIPKNMKNIMLIPRVNNNKRAKLKGLFSDRRISFVEMSSPDGTV